MNRFAAGALALALFCAGALWAHRPAVAQQANQDVWEYRVFRMDPVDYQDKQDYKAILDKEGPRAGDAAPADFEMRVRIPGWARNEAVPSLLYTFAEASAARPSLRVNGEEVALQMDQGFAVIDRTWSSGDTVELELPMPARRVTAHPSVENNAGRMAVQRGPLVYAIEAIDNGGTALDVMLPADTELTAEHRPEMLGGVTEIASFSTDLQIDRSDYGVGVGSWAAALVVGHEVDISIAVEANR